MAESEFPLEIEVTVEDILEVVLEKPLVVRNVVANGKWKIRTRRSPPHETSEDASSPLLWSSTLWSVGCGEACVDAVSIWSCVDDMAVKWRMSH